MASSERAAIIGLSVLLAGPALADPVRVNVHVQPWRYVRELCGADDPARWAGCITWLPAVDNPNDRRCVVHVSNDLSPVDQAITEERLRRQCEG